MKGILKIWTLMSVAAMLLAGCGGTQGALGGGGNLLSASGSLAVTDPLLGGHYYYDTWTFVPTQSARAVFKMESGTITSYIILKNSAGQTIQTGTASGTDDDGNFDGEATMSALVLQGQTYTVTTTSATQFETGAYGIEWPNWVQLTSAGN